MQNLQIYEIIKYMKKQTYVDCINSSIIQSNSSHTKIASNGDKNEKTIIELLGPKMIEKRSMGTRMLRKGPKLCSVVFDID